MIYRISFFFLLFFISISRIKAQVFSTISSAPISDNNTVSNYNISVNVPLNDTLRPSFGVEWVSLSIKHAKLSELAIYLKAPNGLMVPLSVYEGGNDTLFQTIYFKNNAIKKIAQGITPYNDTFLSTHSLAAFNRHNVLPNGNWILMIHDINPGKNTGTMIQASLKLSNQAAKPYLFTTTNLPILSIHTDGVVIPTDPKIKVAYYAIDNPNHVNQLADTAAMTRSNMLIEIRGNSSSGVSSPKKGFLIRTIKTDLSDSNIALFGLPKEHDFILNNFFGDVTFTKDVMSYDLYRKLGRWSPRTKYIELFINNDYRGIYCVFEKIKRDKNRVDIANLKKTDTTGLEVTGGYIFKNDWTDPGDISFTTPQSSKTYIMHQPDSPHASQLAYITGFMRKLDSTLISYKNFSDTINGYRGYLDYKSFIDFILMQEMSLSGDSYIASSYFFKDKDTPGYTSKVNYGPPWDFNYSWGRSFASAKRLRITTINGWKEMFLDTFFLKVTWCRWNELRGTIYSNKSFENYFDSLPNMLQTQIYRDYERWPLSATSPAQFYGNITNGYHYKTESMFIKNYLKTRLPELDSIFLKLCINANVKNLCPPTINVTFNRPGYCIGDSVIAQLGGTIKSYIVNVNNTTIYNSPEEIRYKLENTIPIQIVTNLNGNFGIFYFLPKIDPLPTFPNNIPIDYCANENNLLVIGKNDIYSFRPTNLLLQPISKDSILFKPISNFTATIIAQTINGCKDSISLPFSTHQKPKIKFSGNQKFCTGDSSIITLNESNINWFAKSSSSKLINDTTLLVYNQYSYTYKLQAVNEGCKGDIDSLPITVNPSPILILTPDKPQISNGNIIDLTIKGALHYNWFPKISLNKDTGSQVKANPDTTTHYTIVGTDLNGCKDSVKFTVLVNKTSSVATNINSKIFIQIQSSNIHLTFGEKCNMLQLYNNAGQKIEEYKPNKNYFHFNTSHLSKGIYIIKSVTDSETTSQKIILE